MSADLHCHTRLSDGSMGIDNLVILAKKQGIDTIAITDHDCLAANVRGKLIGERFDIKVIPGVELSATDKETGKRTHIICYLAESPDRLEGLCRRNLLQSKRASQYMMLKAASRYPITPEFILKCAAGSTGVYKQHIMHALMECGLTDSIHGDMYNDIFSSDSPNSILYEGKYPDPIQIIEAIHDAGGIAVLAHPVLYGNCEQIEALAKAGLDGIEVWHPSCKEEDIVYLQQKARSLDLLMTGGSDFHGMYGAGAITIGSCITPDAQFDALMSYKTKRKRQQKQKLQRAQADADAKAAAENNSEDAATASAEQEQ